MDLVKAILTDTPNRDVKQLFIIYSKLSQENAQKEFDTETINLPKGNYSIVYYPKKKITPQELARLLKEYFDEDYSNKHVKQQLQD